MKKHCTTCSCVERKQCMRFVPTSDYRPAGRCIKKARANHDMCGTHIAEGARKLHQAIKETK